MIIYHDYDQWDDSKSLSHIIMVYINGIQQYTILSNSSVSLLKQFQRTKSSCATLFVGLFSSDFFSLSVMTDNKHVDANHVQSISCDQQAIKIPNFLFFTLHGLTCRVKK